MYCKYCGKLIDDDSIFCCKCGKNISSKSILIPDKIGDTHAYNDYKETILSNDKVIENESPVLISSKIPDNEDSKTLEYIKSDRDTVSIIIGVLLIIIIGVLFINNFSEGTDESVRKGFRVFSALVRIMALSLGVYVLGKKNISTGWSFFALLSPGISLVVFGLLKPNFNENKDNIELSEDQKEFMSKYKIDYYNGLFVHGKYMFCTFKEVNDYVTTMPYFKPDILSTSEELIIMEKYGIRRNGKSYVYRNLEFSNIEKAIQEAKGDVN